MNLKPKSKVIIACDKKGNAQRVRKGLGKMDVEVEILSLEGARKELSEKSVHCLLIVIENAESLSNTLMNDFKQTDDNLPIIVISHTKKIENVVRLMKMGIYDYFIFPVDASKLQLAIPNAMRMYHLTKRVFLLENQLGYQTKLDEIIGNSAMMQTIFQTIRNVAKTNANVLISGESGTGKELVAKAIHRLSPRSCRRFIDINCGAIPKELLENELFGHERGAYTGADKRYSGCCEQANGGTLFLDEISEMDPRLQVKLLRFLQERTFSRVGGNQQIRVDVRIVAATNRNLTDLIAQGKFREDLFYRLNVVLILIPPLRDRKEDIPLLAKHFLEKYSHKNEKIFLEFTPEAMESLVQYPWPGNIRELENTIERAVVLHNDTKIKRHHLPKNIQTKSPSEPSFVPNTMENSQILPLLVVERYAIEAALKACIGNVSKAAKRLKIGQATLYRKIKQYGIRT